MATGVVDGSSTSPNLRIVEVIGVGDSAREPTTAGGGRKPPRSRRDVLPWLVAGTAFGVGAAFVAVDLAYNQGHFVAPLDDAYIHLQYARQIGEGHFLQYNTGAPISTGASSLLYVLLLAAGYAAGGAVGLSGRLFLPFAVCVGLLCLAGTAACTYRMGRLLAGRRVGLWAGGLVAVSGPVVWGATSGMEVGLVALLVTWMLLRYLKETPAGRFPGTPALGVLVALARPEGLILAAVVCAAMSAALVRRMWLRTLPVRRGLARIAWCLLPLVAGAAQLGFSIVATGTASANGIQSKSLLNDNPVFYPFQFVDRTITALRSLVGVFTGLNTQDFTFPGALLFFVMGIVFLVGFQRQWRTFGMVVGLGLAAVVTSVSTLDSALVHNLRYIQPFIPLFALLAVLGVHGLTSMLTSGRTRGILQYGVLLTAVLFSVAALPKWGVRLGEESATIRDVPVSVGVWLQRNLPPDAVVGVKDVGAATYFGNHQVVDLIGLTTNGLAKPSINGAGSLYEALRHMPADQRPDYFAVYDTPPGPPLDDLRQAGVISGDPLATFTVHTPVNPTDGLVVPFARESIYRADWSDAGSGDRPQNEIRAEIRDYVNVGDLDGERAHDYRPRIAQVGVQPTTVLTRVSGPGGTVVDSGRQILGGEVFTAHNLVPGRQLTLTARSRQVWPFDGMQVLVNGEPAGILPMAMDKTGWHESSLIIPGGLVTGPTVTVELTARRPFLNPYPEYTSFGYWLSQ